MTSRRSFLTRSFALVVAICLVVSTNSAAPSASAEQIPMMPADFVIDPQLAAAHLGVVMTGVGVSLAFRQPMLAGLILFAGLGYTALCQSALFQIAHFVEERYLSAWTVESLLEVDYQLRAAINAVPDMVAKLEKDKQILNDRIRQARSDKNYKGLTGAAAQAADEAIAEDEGRLTAVERVLERAKRVQDEVKAKGEEAKTAFDAARKDVIAGTHPIPTTDAKGEPIRDPLLTAKAWNREVISEMAEAAEKLVAFVKVAIAAQTDLFDSTFMKVPVGSQMMSVQPTSNYFKRLEITNDSKDMVFLIRTNHSGIVLKGEKGDVSARPWIALYPKGEAIRVNSSEDIKNKEKIATAPEQQGPAGATAGLAASGSAIEIALPSSTWFPMEPGDQLEVRAITYGLERKMIRWQSVSGKSLRPDLDSMRRSFYYQGTELWFAGQYRNTGYRRYPLAEEYYQWEFSDNWKNTVKRDVETTLVEAFNAPPWVTNWKVPVRMIDEKGGHTFELKGAHDHIAWTVPKDDLAILDGAILTLKVKGKAKIVHALAMSSPRPDDIKTEEAEGALTIALRPW